MIKYCFNTDDQEKLILPKSFALTDLDKLIVMRNIISNLIKDKSYYFTKNCFEINFLEIDNMTSKNFINFDIESLFEKKLNYGKIKYEYVHDDEDKVESYKNNLENKLNNNTQKNMLNNDEKLDSDNRLRNTSMSSNTRRIIRQMKSRNVINLEKDKNNKIKFDDTKEKFNLRLVKL